MRNVMNFKINRWHLSREMNHLLVRHFEIEQVLPPTNGKILTFILFIF